jgi:hypothetical protein
MFAVRMLLVNRMSSVYLCFDSNVQVDSGFEFGKKNKVIFWMVTTFTIDIWHQQFEYYLNMLILKFLIFFKTNLPNSSKRKHYLERKNLQNKYSKQRNQYKKKLIWTRFSNLKFVRNFIWKTNFYFFFLINLFIDIEIY